MTVKYHILQETYRVPYIYQNAKYRRFEISVPKDIRKAFGAKKLTFSFKFMQRCRIKELIEVSETIAPYYLDMFEKLRSGELKFNKAYSHIEAFKKEIEMLYESDESALLRYLLEEIISIGDMSGHFSVERGVMLAVRLTRELKNKATKFDELNKNFSFA